MDQRGCGRSTPHVTTPSYDLSQNTTAELLDDLERLREHLNINCWLLNGVSCGSTLAFAYAQRYPQRVLGIVVFAVRTDGRFEIDWITEGVAAIYPEAWDRLATHAERAAVGYRRGSGRLIEAYARLMSDADPAVRDGAAAAWVEWEDHHISLAAGEVQRNPHWEDLEYRNVFATLVTHYWANDFFLDPPILDRMDRLAGILSTLIHGRRDVSGPAVIAWRLHRAWPDSELIICETDGHGGPTMVEQMCFANSRHADRIQARYQSAEGRQPTPSPRPSPTLARSRQPKARICRAASVGQHPVAEFSGRLILCSDRAAGVAGDARSGSRSATLPSAGASAVA